MNLANSSDIKTCFVSNTQSTNSVFIEEQEDVEGEEEKKSRVK